jgi:S-adenosylmethionine hydrolase
MPSPVALVAVFGSTDHLEIAINGASAASLLKVGRGTPVEVVRRA